MVAKMVELRKGKMTPEECAANLKKSNYFGTMLVKMGVADALLGGATYSTADTVRPALQLIKTKPGAHLVSSCFILVRGDEMLAMGDCAINISYEDTWTKRATSPSPQPTSWPRSARRPPRPPRSSASTPRWPS
jgi:phosphate acetyltransferase